MAARVHDSRFLDLLTPSAFHDYTFRDLKHVDELLTRSAVHAGFALHLSSSSKQGYFR
jgi:hypothetical protein